jgi:hypothetical protein
MARRAILLVLLGCLGLACAAVASAASSSRPGPVLYGVSVDRVSDLSHTASALHALPRRATLRMVFDRYKPPSYYAAPARRLASVSWVMGELLDSSQEKTISASALRRRATHYLHRVGRYVSIWEVGNELNGNWTGAYGEVAAKTRAAFSVFTAAHVRTAITLYANDFGPDHCGDGPAELTPEQFARRYLSRTLRGHMDYLLLSYYPTQCADIEPTSRQVASHLRQLHRLFPHARLGFGEIGLPNPATAASVRRARQIMAWAYALNPDLPYYTGGYFWWYGAEDALRPRGLLRRDLARAFAAERAALARGQLRAHGHASARPALDYVS